MLGLSEDVRKHLAVAIRAYRTRSRELNLPVPPELRQLEEGWAASLSGSGRVRTGQPGSTFDAVGRLAQALSHGDGEELVTQQQAARLLGVSPSTVKRRVASGDLAVVKIGRSVRLRREDIRRYASPQRKAPPS